MSAIRIGTRGSPLALAQAEMVAKGLNDEGRESTIVVINTTGDRIRDRPLSEVGGKGLFTKEIESALLGNTIDCAVHSAKDLETTLPAPLRLAAFLPREDVRDAFIGRGGQRLADLPAGATVGTASLRRQALVRRVRPDLNVAVLRGNVGTRLDKLEAGECEGTLLALAGLNRLGLAHVATEILAADTFPPALAQGAIAIEIRRDDARTETAIRALNDAATETAVLAERGFLAALDGSCRTPIAGLAEVSESADGGRMVALRGLVALPDGSAVEETHVSGPADAAASLGFEAGRALKARLDPRFLTMLG